MKIQDAREYYVDFTGRASDVSRQLAFAALALVWVFKVDRPGGGAEVPHALLLPAAIAIAALAADLMQYAYASAAWGLFYRHKEKELDLDEKIEIHAPREINWPTIGLFWTKITAVVASYVLLLLYVGATLWR